MPRIAGVTIPSEKRTEVSLTYIYGIGPATAKKLLADLKIDGNIRAKDLTEAQLDQIRARIEKGQIVEGDLRREISGNIKRLRDISSNVGIRHMKKLPVHGQRTKTNARTKRGKRFTVGSGRKAAPSKT